MDLDAVFELSGAPFRPVVAPLLHAEVARQLRELITGGQLAPGQSLSERQLGKYLGVSRTPLREALRSLAGEGLVELSPRKGAQVARLDRTEVTHVFAVMEALEALAGTLACASITDAELVALEVLHAQLVAAFKKREKDEFYSLNQKIHEAILRAAHNPVLIKTYEGLGGQMLRARYLGLNTLTQWRAAVQEHEEIMQALRLKDAQRMQLALAAHLKAKEEKVKRAVAA